MSNFNITVELNKVLAGAELTLINGLFDKISSTTTNKLTAAVPPGLYHVRIEAPGYYQEEYIRVDKDQNFVVDIKSISAFPVSPYTSTRDALSQSAQQHSKQTTHQGNSALPPNFLFFIAEYDVPAVETETPYQQFALYNDKATIRFKADNSYSNLKEGVSIFSTHLEPGLYFLSHAPTNGEERIIPIYIFDQKQTQFFIRFRTIEKQHVLDFFNSRIFVADKMEFDFNDPSYATMEQLLMGFSKYEYYKLLTPEELTNISKSSFLIALSNILHLALKESLPFKSELALPLPDIQFLTTYHGDKTLVAQLSEKVPLLSFVMYTYSSAEHGYVTAASLMDRVAEHLNYDLFWSSFTKIDSPQLIAKKIRRGIRESSMVGKMTELIDKFNPFSGDVDIDEVRKEVSAHTKSHVNERTIAKKLNVPVTTVIRNLEGSKKAYNAILDKERALQDDDFFNEPVSSDGPKSLEDIERELRIRKLELVVKDMSTHALRKWTTYTGIGAVLLSISGVVLQGIYYQKASTDVKEANERLKAENKELEEKKARLTKEYEEKSIALNAQLAVERASNATADQSLQTASNKFNNLSATSINLPQETKDKIKDITSEILETRQELLAEVQSIPITKSDTVIKQSETSTDPTTKVYPDDPQKGKWGMKAEQNGRKIVVSYKKLVGKFYTLTIRVLGESSNPLTGKVTFHLHDSFKKNQNPVVVAENNEAVLKLKSYGAFTIGAEADGGTTKLEFDMAEDPNAPDDFKKR